MGGCWTPYKDYKQAKKARDDWEKEIEAEKKKKKKEEETAEFQTEKKEKAKAEKKKKEAYEYYTMYGSAEEQDDLFKI